VVCGSPGAADVSVASIEELTREPGESGSSTEKLGAAKFVMEVVVRGVWATAIRATAVSRASATPKVRWVRRVRNGRWLRVEVKMITSLGHDYALSGHGKGNVPDATFYMRLSLCAYLNLRTHIGNYKLSVVLMLRGSGVTHAALIFDCAFGRYHVGT
jgi:hypothetical protein